MPQPKKKPLPQITYEQIKRELMASGEMPEPIPEPSPSPTPDTRYPFDPLVVAEERAKVQEPFARFSVLANPETQRKPGEGGGILDKIIQALTPKPKQ